MRVSTSLSTAHLASRTGLAPACPWFAPRHALEHDVGYHGVVVELARRLLRGADAEGDPDAGASCHEVRALLS